MNLIAAYFDGLDEKLTRIENRLNSVENGINRVNPQLAEIIDFFNAGPAAFRAANPGPEIPAPGAASGENPAPAVTEENPAANPGPEIPAAKSPAPGAAVTGEIRAENPAPAVTGSQAPAPSPAPAAGGKNAEKTNEIKAQDKNPAKSTIDESRSPVEIELGALAKQLQAERAAALENATVSTAEEKTAAPASQAQAERAQPVRGEVPSEADLEPLRNRVSALVRGIRPGDADIAQALRERIRTGALWPVSACTTWERFDQLKNFLDNAGA